MDIGSIVRVGTVDSINTVKKTARVRFEDLDNMMSGDLPVLQHPAAVSVTESGDFSGPHTALLSAWMPALGQMVVCLYVPIDDGDGYILGGVVMIIGSLGDHIFEVSTSVVKTLDDFEWDSAARWVKHDRHLGETLLEFTGVDPDSISFSIYLSAYLGVDPQAAYIALLMDERAGKIMTLAIGEKLYGKFKWVIEKSKRGKWKFLNTGRPLALEVSLTLLAYPAG